ncbi:GAF domain-like protein [Entophlyctis helioformis]|nr:GAF domain-like protein [Entophlyctis helioformis]
MLLAAMLPCIREIGPLLFPTTPNPYCVMVAQSASSYPTDKAEFYKQLNEEVAAIVDPSLPLVSNLANVSSVLYWAFHSPSISRPVNWVGFYLLSKAGTLVLGPFQGRVACTIIKLGKGVCGTSAQERRTVLVTDVHAFPGHIACDSASESEIVVPLVRPTTQQLIGVLDLDSTILNGYDELDQSGLEAIVQTLLTTVTDWTFE